MWELSQNKALRILAYHGIVEDEQVTKPWIPSYFVSVSSFRQQLEYLKKKCYFTALKQGSQTPERKKTTKAGCQSYFR